MLSTFLWRLVVEVTIAGTKVLVGSPGTGASSNLVLG
jgi:hypothetical protein